MIIRLTSTQIGSPHPKQRLDDIRFSGSVLKCSALKAVSCLNNYERLRCRQHDPILISESGPPSFAAFRVVHCILKFLFAPEVTLSCLDRSVAEQKLNLFQFAS